jgi:hypothetical protein
MIDGGSLGEDVDFDHRDLLREVAELISEALGNLHGIGDDPMQNDELLRTAVTGVALKSFLAGNLAGLASSGAPGGGESGVVVRCSPGELEQIGLAAIRDGVLTFHLVSDIEPPSEDDSATD